MQPLTRYGLAVLAAVVAGALAAVVAEPVLEPSLVWFVAGANAVVYATTAHVLLGNYERLGRLAAADPDDYRTSMKWGGIAGGFTSVGVTSVLGLLAATASFRLGAAVALLVFGFGMGSLAIGIGAISDGHEAFAAAAGEGAAAVARSEPVRDCRSHARYEPVNRSMREMRACTTAAVSLCWPALDTRPAQTIFGRTASTFNYSTTSKKWRR